jgi:MFS family permease
MSVYISVENRKKVFLLIPFTALSAASAITGKTLANSIILTAYPTSILPFFYSFLALSFIISSLMISKYQHRYPRKFPMVSKLIYLFLLIIIFGSLQWGYEMTPFVVAILILTFGLITSILPWNYLSEIFLLQEFKKYNKLFQIASTIGGILIGVLFASLKSISSNFTSPLIIIILITELLSLLCSIPLSKYTPISVIEHRQTLKSFFPKNSLFKSITVLFVATVIITMLVDYNFKLALAASIEKSNIPHMINRINIIYIMGILIIDVFFIDYFFKVLGGKNFIIIYPLVLSVMSLITLLNDNFFWVAFLFIMNEMFSTTIFVIARDLYLNILPLATKRIARLQLGGLFKSLATLFTSLIIWILSFVSYSATLSLILIAILSLYSVYLAKILIQKYIKQLSKSVYLRRFEPELLSLGHLDQKDFNYLIQESLNYPDPDAKFYGLQLLSNPNSQLPDKISEILLGEDASLSREVAKLLANHRNQRQFIKEATSVFINASDAEIKWYLALYLVEYGAEDCLYLIDNLLKINTTTSIAIICLIYLKQGDLEQHLTATKFLVKMLHSDDNEAKKWFLILVGEFSWLQKEKYLIQFINHEIASLQVLAIQRIGLNPSPYLLESLTNHIGFSNIAYVLNMRLISIGEQVIGLLVKKYHEAPTYQFKLPCISILSQIKGKQAEDSLIKISFETQGEFMRTMVAKYLAYRSVTMELSNHFKNELLESIRTEIKLYEQLRAHLMHYGDSLIRLEISSYMQWVKRSALYFVSAFIGSIDILNSISILDSFKMDKNQQSLALELIESTSENREISSLLTELFTDKNANDSLTMEPIASPWLCQFIQYVESDNMQPIYTYTRLRKIELFKNLPSETLQVLANCCISRNMSPNEIIFKEGDIGDGLYIIDSGEVIVSKEGKEINRLGEFDYFGELALLSDIPRFATITARTEGMLFFINNIDFDRITDEIPEIMKDMIKHIINYLIIGGSKK